MKTKRLLLRVVECQRCGGEGPQAGDRETAQLRARDAGWAQEHGVTMCPDCRQRARKR